MKTMRFAVLFFVAFFLSLNIHAQSCEQCSPSKVLLTPGFIDLDSIPCIIQAEPYTYSVLFHMPPTLVVYGDTLNIDSIHVLDVANLPCGLCWNTQAPPLNTFAANQTGCISISGTTMDSTGQYPLAMTWYAYFGRTAKAILPAILDTNGLRVIVRVVSPTGSCLPVDTSTGAQKLMTNLSRCAAGVNEIPGDISLFDVFPNPLNTGAVISFTALKDGKYTLRLTDITGRIIRTQQLQVHTGVVNKVELQRQNLPAGIYFLSIGNDGGALTKKLLVAD